MVYGTRMMMLINAFSLHSLILLLQSFKRVLSGSIVDEVQVNNFFFHRRYGVRLLLPSSVNGTSFIKNGKKSTKWLKRRCRVKWREINFLYFNCSFTFFIFINHNLLFLVEIIRCAMHCLVWILTLVWKKKMNHWNDFLD